MQARQMRLVRYAARNPPQTSPFPPPSTTFPPVSSWFPPRSTWFPSGTSWLLSGTTWFVSGTTWFLAGTTWFREKPRGIWQIPSRFLRVGCGARRLSGHRWAFAACKPGWGARIGWARRGRKGKRWRDLFIPCVRAKRVKTIFLIVTTATKVARRDARWSSRHLFFAHRFSVLVRGAHKTNLRRRRKTRHVEHSVLSEG